MMATLFCVFRLKNKLNRKVVHSCFLTVSGASAPYAAKFSRTPAKAANKETAAL
jgi:hypothetical protein